jgi:hypothetical protein
MDTKSIQQYKPQQQRDINLARLHLQALTLSDLSQADGNTIRKSALQGYREDHQRLRSNWPRQDNLTSSQRKLWTQYITSNFLRYDRYWRQPLGEIRTATSPHSAHFHNIIPTMVDVSTTTPPGNLSTYILRLPQWHQQLLGTYRQDASDVHVWKAFRSRKRITIASDGGLKHKIRHLRLEDC